MTTIAVLPKPSFPEKTMMEVVEPAEGNALAGSGTGAGSVAHPDTKQINNRKKLGKESSTKCSNDGMTEEVIENSVTG